MKMAYTCLVLHWPSPLCLSVSATPETLRTALTSASGTLDYGVPYVGRWLVQVLQVLWFVYVGIGLLIAMTMEYTVRGSLRPLAAISPADCLLVFVSWSFRYQCVPVLFADGGVDGSL
jgi:hypothetical protein